MKNLLSMAAFVAVLGLASCTERGPSGSGASPDQVSPTTPQPGMQPDNTGTAQDTMGGMNQGTGTGTGTGTQGGGGTTNPPSGGGGQ